MQAKRPTMHSRVYVFISFEMIFLTISTNIVHKNVYLCIII